MTIETTNENTSTDHPSTVPSLEALVNELKAELETVKELLVLSRRDAEFSQSQVENLQATNTALRTDIQTSKINHVKDVTLIGNTLIEKADEYDWCSTYDSAVNDLNQRLTIELPLRRATFTVTGTITFPFSYTVELSGNADEADAEEYLEDLDSDEINYDTSRYNRQINVDSVERD